MALGVPSFFVGSAAADTGVAGDGLGACTVTVIPPPTPVSLGSTIALSLVSTCGADTFAVFADVAGVSKVADVFAMGTITTDELGNGSSGPVTLPCAAHPGTDTITADDGKGNVGSTSVTVTPAPCASAPGLAISPE
jgi:hypothetical protein